MSALRRVVSAIGWALALWLVFVLLAKASSAMVGTAAATAVAPYAGPVPGREDLFALAQLTYMERGLRSIALTAPTVLALGGTLVWTLVSGIVIARLDGPRDASALGEVGVRTLPGVLAQSVWHGLLRAVLLVLIAVSLGPLSPIAMLVGLAVGWLLSSLALDLTRVGVVLHGARPLHPATAAYAFVRATQRPRLLAITSGLSVAQMLCALALAYGALAAIGPSSSAVSTALLSAVGVLVGLLRLSVVIGHGAVPLRSISSSS